MPDSCLSTLRYLAPLGKEAVQGAFGRQVRNGFPPPFRWNPQQRDRNVPFGSELHRKI